MEQTAPLGGRSLIIALRKELFAAYPKAVGWGEAEVEKWLRTNALRAMTAELPDVVPFERFTGPASVR